MYSLLSHSFQFSAFLTCTIISRLYTPLAYYRLSEKDQLYMLYIFPKNAQENLTDTQTKALRQTVERWSL